MKVLMLLSQPKGASIGTDVRANGLARGLKSLGVEVEVVSPFGSDSNNSSGDFGFFRYRSLVSSLGMYRIIGQLSWFLARQLRKEVERFKPDIIQGEQEIAAAAAIHLGKLFKIPIVTDIHGSWPEELLAEGKIRQGSGSYKSVLKFEHHIVENSNAILVVSEELRNYVIKSYFADASKVKIVPNAAIKRRNFPRSLDSLQSGYGLVYSGTIQTKENIQLFIEAATMVGRSNPADGIYVTDRGNAIENVKKALAERKVPANYFWIPDEGKFYDFLGKFHTGVLPAARHPWRVMGTPAKLFDYLSVGVPVVATDIGASWNLLIKEENVGLVTDSSPKNFADAIQAFLNDPEMIIEYGNRCLRLVNEKLNYEESAKLLITIYNKLI
jgi:glycosyltransferase involved in cell wall biosynthesis